MLSFSRLLFTGFSFPPPSHEDNYSSGRQFSSFSYPKPPNEIIYCATPATAGRYVLRRKKRVILSAAKPREEENLSPLSFPIKF